MFKDFKIFLWLLKFGALVNIYFFVKTYQTDSPAHILIPAQILFAVSAYRCLFPVQYKDNVVFHDSLFSSIFITRLLATFSEVAYIYLLSYVIRLLNFNHIEWVNLLSWLMVFQVVISQYFVWNAILTERLIYFFYEELGWVIIFIINTILNTFLYFTVGSFNGAEVLIYLSLLFGGIYVPWQFVHLRFLFLDAMENLSKNELETNMGWRRLKAGLKQSIVVINPRYDSKAWGGFIGLTWMFSYWAILIPLWVNQIVAVFSR
jgi:hypothetical protein